MVIRVAEQACGLGPVHLLFLTEVDASPVGGSASRRSFFQAFSKIPLQIISLRTLLFFLFHSTVF